MTFNPNDYLNGLVSWDDNEFSVGIQELDAQHKVIVQCINKLYLAIESDSECQQLPSLFETLIEYTGYHFETEQRYFHNLSKHERLLHHLHHKHFLEEISLLYANRGNTRVTAIELLFLLTDWLISHILEEDKLLVQAELESVELIQAE